MNKPAANNNKIIFLTTLGVYLGLLLVGGSAPQVFAHGALTRSFELRDEIETTDDLDKNPDEERSTLSESLGVYLQDVEFFLRCLQRLHSEGKFDSSRNALGVADTQVTDLNSARELFRPKTKDILRLSILENLSFKSQNDQVFVVTRLPRASIDSLLASNAQ